MKNALPLLLVASVLAACSHQSQTITPGAPGAAAPTPARPRATPPGPTPAHSRSGKIASVKAELRFVVVDFAVSGLPAEGTPMAVYRAGQKVGEIRITGPAVGSNTAADITGGEARAGDEVRDL